jgi:oxygen-dependent protoporphyrinogen oxidase
MGQRGFRVLPAEGPTLEADAVVLACPSWHAAPMVEQTDPELCGLIAGINAAPLAVVHMGFRTLALGDQPAGFGYLVPRGQGPRILGTLWISQIFEGRAPAGTSLFTTMIGGAHDPGVLQLDDEALIEIVREDLRTTMSITVRPYFTRLVRWPRGIPQYTLGHLGRLRQIERRLSAHPGLFVAGNSYRGISVNACVEEAPQVAESLLEFIDRRERAWPT